MRLTSTDTDSGSRPSAPTRQELLQHARRLDRFGRDAEQFLSRQLEQLEAAINEFERDKAAWRRQMRRESSQLAEQREQLDRMRDVLSDGATGSEASIKFKREIAERDARKSGTRPMRILFEAHDASPMQVGVLLFEISKLNRDMGGQGVRFEVADVRAPKKRLLGIGNGNESSAEIFELHGFPTLPLKARGNHVTLDVEVTDRVEEWILFKTRLMQSALSDGELASWVEKYKSVPRGIETRNFIREATRPPGQSDAAIKEPDPYTGAALLAGSQIDIVRQQIMRLESCYDRLHSDSGLIVQVQV